MWVKFRFKLFSFSADIYKFRFTRSDNTSVAHYHVKNMKIRCFVFAIMVENPQVSLSLIKLFKKIFHKFYQQYIQLNTQNTDVCLSHSTKTQSFCSMKGFKFYKLLFYELWPLKYGSSSAFFR